jgi:hypothetical protein
MVIKCYNCPKLNIIKNEDDLDDWYYCDKAKKYLNNLHEGLKKEPEWCPLDEKLVPLNE